MQKDGKKDSVAINRLLKFIINLYIDKQIVKKFLLTYLV